MQKGSISTASFVFSEKCSNQEMEASTNKAADEGKRDGTVHEGQNVGIFRGQIIKKGQFFKI